MHSKRTVLAALRLGEAGATATEVARQLGISRRTVSDWLRGAVPRSAASDGCTHDASELTPQYVYLLELYLGDGCISAHPRGVYRLRIVLDVKYPGIIASAAAAMSDVRAGPTLSLMRPQNCIEVSSYWKCWPCLFPQHGPGQKHNRLIALTGWQQRLVDRWPEQLLRGLIHSDGCRFLNTGRGNWSCPRYTFTNHSSDIRGIFCRACEQLGLHWTASGDYVIYISRKADVARLDEFIGPKR